MTTNNNLICNICGNTTFQAGPAGRMSHTGIPPLCKQCMSLERQRIVRNVMGMFPPEILSGRRALLFSEDNSLDEGWFKSFETSIYGGSNSMDIQQIPRPNNSYDFVSFSHVLEFVPNDRMAFSEIMRILSPTGILQACFSGALSRPTSEDHFDKPVGSASAVHLFGRDLTERFNCKALGINVLAIKGCDPVTKVTESVHFFLKSSADRDAILKTISRSPDYSADLILASDI